MLTIAGAEMGNLAGYTPGAPANAYRIDKAVAEAARCPECGGRMTYRPYRKQENYRAFAVCCCGYAIEF